MGKIASSRAKGTKSIDPPQPKLGAVPIVAIVGEPAGYPSHATLSDYIGRGWRFHPHPP
jgi:hypothetical protein